MNHWVELVVGAIMTGISTWTLHQNRGARKMREKTAVTVAEIKKDVNSGHSAVVATADNLQLTVTDLEKTVATLRERIVGLERAAEVIEKAKTT